MCVRYEHNSLFVTGAGPIWRRHGNSLYGPLTPLFAGLYVLIRGVGRLMKLAGGAGWFSG